MIVLRALESCTLLTASGVKSTGGTPTKMPSIRPLVDPESAADNGGKRGGLVGNRVRAESPGLAGRNQRWRE
jgi:hypothetical protein